ncbi:MAG: hypothetical protein HFH72_05520 [Lachnospiraceae bacterium]|nr:hypothetical protein [Lachnospiraceae bacterium]
MKENNVNMKGNFKKALSLSLALILILGCVLINGQRVFAKTTEFYTNLIQKSNSNYSDYIKDGLGVAYKVKLNKKTIVINGTLKNASTEKLTRMGKHTYKLSNSVKYIASGGEGPDQKFSQKAYKKYLESCKDSLLSLSLTLRNGKVTKVAICS